VGRNARFFYVIFYGVFLRIEEEQQQRSRRRRTLKKVSTSNFILFPANYTLPTAQVLFICIMEGADEKTGSQKAVVEASSASKDSERSHGQNISKDTTEDLLKSKAGSLEETGGHESDGDTAMDVSTEQNAPQEEPAADVATASPRPNDTPNRRPSREAPPSTRSRTTRSGSATPGSRRSTRSGGQTSLVDGLKEASPTSSNKSSGSKPLRDSHGKFISKKMTSDQGNDQVTTEEPPKQSLETTLPLSGQPTAKEGSTEPMEVDTESVAIVPGQSSLPDDGDGKPAAVVPTNQSGSAVTVATQGKDSVSNSLAEPVVQQSVPAKEVAGAAAAAVEPAPTANSDAAQTKPPIPQAAPVAATAKIDSSQQVAASASAVAPSTVKQAPPTSAPPAADDFDTSVAPTDIAPGFANMSTRGLQHAADEAAIYEARAPLTTLYGQYICKSTDSSLDDARARLKKAIAQTRDLRQVFTERVYDKYRVCLKPPEETEAIIARIMKDPAGEHRRLKEVIAVIRDEKEIEKKEANKLNMEMQQSGAGDRASLLSNVDNAEQVMFLTAGLNLVILPEDQAVDPKLVEGYPERGPVDSSGQRVKSISQGAATAGEVILDRTRKAAAMRVERQRRRQLQLLRGEVVVEGETESNYSRLQVLAAASSSNAAGKAAPKPSKTTTATAKSVPTAAARKAPTAAAKGARSRPQTPSAVTALLNLHPTADEVKIDTKPSASTIALMARGVGPAANKTTQQRLRHPHPDSLGGRRRASANPAKPPEPFSQANLANTLPPLPSTKDRLERKALTVQNVEEASSSRARESIQHVMKSFAGSDGKQPLRPVSKINLLNGLRKQRSESGSSTQLSRPLNPALTVSVLHALGFVVKSQDGAPSKPYSLPNVDHDNKAVWSDKLKDLRGKIVSHKTKMDDIVLRGKKHQSSESPRKRPSAASNSEPAAKVARTDQPNETLDPKETAVPVESIRGGGGGVIMSDGDRSEGKAESTTKSDKSESRAQLGTKQAEASVDDPKKRKRSNSSPGRPPAAAATGAKRRPSEPAGALAYQPPNQAAGFLGPPQMGATMNAMHIASQLRHMHHPAPGDFADYIGGLQQQGYDLSSLIGGHQAQPNSHGMSLPDHSAAAAMLFREQQAAALLGAYPPGFPPVAHHPAAFPTFFSGQGPYGQAQMSGPGPSQQPPMASAGKETAKPPAAKAASKSAAKEIAKAAAKEASSKPAAKEAPKPVATETAEPIARETAKPAAKETVKSEAQVATQKASKQQASDNTPAAQANGNGQPGAMKFSAPAAPKTLTQERVHQIRAGRFHKAVAELDESGSSAALKILLSAGAAVPIPKGLVLGPLKERLNTPGFKNAGNNSAPPITRDVVAAAILVWLWSAHEHTFRQAFEKNGRIDVDPDCKWLIQAAVDSAVGELSLEIAESLARGEGVFAEAAAARKDDPSAQNAKEGPHKAPEKLDVLTASIVSRALAVEMHIDGDMNAVVPKYQYYVQFLDESRIGALRAKSQERALLATLLARKAMMTESFAHAYVSAMVRAGEALGHGKLFEIAQDEVTMASTMIPYDILTDDGGLWEDPCKPDNGFTEGLTGDELIRRAHARAMIQKSLRNLQDRNHIRGGTSSYGPFVDPVHSEPREKKPAPGPSPRPGPKRRMSSFADSSITPGTGSAQAKSWTVYEPNHNCSPLDWDPDILENAPYGVHSVSSERMRSMSMSLGKDSQDAVKTKRSMSLSLSQLAPRDQPESDSKLLQSTREINWEDVVSTFQSVELPRKPRHISDDDHHHSMPVFVDGTIFAPYCREIQGDLSSDEDESDTEEDLTEDTTLARHQVVLDEMKQKLNAYLEARKQQQEARKNRYK